MKYQDAEKLFDKAIEIYSDYPEFQDHLLIANTFYNASKNLIRKGDIEKALTCSHKALAFTEKHFSENDPISGDIMEVVATCYHKLSSFSKSKFYYEKSLSIFKNSLGENTSETSRIYDRLGRLHITFDKYETAIQYFQKSLSIRKKLFGLTNFKIGESYDNIGNSYYYLGKYSKALLFFKKALVTFRSSASNTTIADQYSKIAACHTNLKEFKAANSYMDSCFEVLNFNWRIGSPFEEYKSSLTHLLITLYFKAKNHQKAYEAGWGKEELYKASHWFDLCIELIEYINSTFEESGSKKYLLDRFYYVFEARSTAIIFCIRRRTACSTLSAPLDTPNAVKPCC